MTPQYKAFHISLLFHLVLATALLCGCQILEEQTPPLVIDFSLTLSEAIAGEPNQHPGLPAASVKAITPPTQTAVPPPEQIQQPVPQPVKVVRKTLQSSKPKPRPQTKKERQAPPPLAETSTEPAPLTSVDPTQGVSAAATSTASTGSPMSTNTAISGGGVKGGNRGDGDGMHYDFSYVRQLILKNLHFPAVARKMGLTGKIVVTFVLKTDGQVEEITVVDSSGHDILDNTVVATIRRVAPFPKPPVSAQLKLPIVFNLK